MIGMGVDIEVELDVGVLHLTLIERRENLKEEVAGNVRPRLMALVGKCIVAGQAFHIPDKPGATILIQPLDKLTYRHDPSP